MALLLNADKVFVSMQGVIFSYEDNFGINSLEWLKLLSERPTGCALIIFSIVWNMSGLLHVSITVPTCNKVTACYHLSPALYQGIESENIPVCRCYNLKCPSLTFKWLKTRFKITWEKSTVIWFLRYCRQALHSQCSSL